ncbi:MAG: type II toxin-antitoxin system VapC family toxin [Chlorobaculum sp.]|jgi:predicted nucleic acid-binding protein|nr:type II toxin-antitoxin system VapC family toxin [Chlorobaculum sp.]
MNVVDSSGWLEYFAGSPTAEHYAAAIEDFANLVVPVISLYEVFKRILQQRGEGSALQAIAFMQQGEVIELTAPLSLSAARISVQEKLPMADSIMLATARAHGATLWTQDSDFRGLENVRYFEK